MFILQSYFKLFILIFVLYIQTLMCHSLEMSTFKVSAVALLGLPFEI